MKAYKKDQQASLAKLLDMSSYPAEEESVLSMGPSVPMPVPTQAAISSGQKVPGGTMMPNGTAVLDDIVATGASAPLREMPPAKPEPKEAPKPSVLVEDTNTQTLKLEKEAKAKALREAIDRVKNTTGSSADTLAPIQEFSDRYSALSEMDHIRALQEGLNAQESTLEEEFGSPMDMPVDVRSIAAWTDGEFGTKFASALDRPIDPNIERRRLLTAGLDRVQDNRKDLAKTLLETAKGQITGKKTQQEQIEEMSRQLNELTKGQTATNTVEDKKSNPALEGLRGNSRRNPQVNNPKEKVYTEFMKNNRDAVDGLIHAFPKIQSSLNEGTAVGDAFAINAIIRLSGDKTIAVADRQGLADQGIPNTLERLSQKLTSGTAFTPKDRADAKKAAKAVAGVLRKSVNEQIKSHAEAGEYYQGVPRGEAEANLRKRIAGALDEPAEKKRSGKSSVKKATDDEIANMSDAQFEAYQKAGGR